MLATFRVFGRFLFLWDCALVFCDSRHLQFILLGVDPRIENVMVCVPREWHFFGIREVHIFSLWTATSLIALHFSCLWLISHNFIVLAHKDVLVHGLGKSTLKAFDFMNMCRSLRFCSDFLWL